MKLTLKTRLLKYLQSHEGWHAKGNLADLARASELHATGEATGRRLRELEESKVIEVEIRGQHAFYRLREENAPQGQISPNNGTPGPFLEGPALTNVLKEMDYYFAKI